MSRDSSVRSRLVGLVNQVLGTNAEPVDQRAVEVKLSELGVSSLKMVNLMLSVEIEFDIAIPQNEITPENFYSVATIETMLTRLSPALQA